MKIVLDPPSTAPVLGWHIQLPSGYTLEDGTQDFYIHVRLLLCQVTNAPSCFLVLPMFCPSGAFLFMAEWYSTFYLTLHPLMSIWCVSAL